MKKLRTLITATVLLSLITAAPAAENKKKKDKVKAPETPSAATVEVMSRFDKNKNGILDASERAEVRKAFAADTALKPLDLNGDGRLDEGELDKAEGITKAKGKGKKK